MRLRKKIALAAGLLAMAAGLAGALRADTVDDYLKSEMAHRRVPGLSVAALRNGRIVKAKGYGLANVELSVPATAETIYPIGSLSKQFTATAILLLVQAGRVGLDDPIGKYLLDLPQAWQAVTVRGLLNQTSGLPERVPAPDKDPLLKAYPLAAIVRNAAEKPLAFPPGTGYAYSNTNYNLLAGIIEKAAGKPYGDFLGERLFKPLGMNATGVYDPQDAVKGRSAGYNRSQGKVYNNVILYDPSYLAGAGGLQSTVGDLARWDAAVAGGWVLPLPVMSQAWTPPALPGGAKTDYGMGWVSQTVSGHRIVWHNGALPGAMAFLGRFPDDHLTVVILSNLFPLDDPDDRYPFLPLGQGVAACYVPALAPAKETVPDEPEVTRLLKQVLVDQAAGRADPSHFTPEMSVALTPAVIAQTNLGLTPLGALKPESLMLVKRMQEGALRVYRYHALYGHTPVVWVVHLTTDGKIAGMVPQAE